MVMGDGAAAVQLAEEGVGLARGMVVPSTRHRVKSAVVLAAALCSAGDIDRAHAVARPALDDAGRFGLIPLRWALACLLIDTGSVTFEEQGLRELAGIRDICAAQVQRAGGAWRSA